jgi:superfamily II DNA or RNA helicase
VYRPDYEAIEKLEGKLTGCLATQKGNSLIIPGGFWNYILTLSIPYEDLRTYSKEEFSLPLKEPLYTPREYQKESIEVALQNSSGVICLGTGMGKSLVSMYLTKSVKVKTLIVAPNKSIALQLHKEYIRKFGEIKVGFYGDGKKKLNDITIGIAKSCFNDVEKLNAFGFKMIIMDEAHHSPAQTFSGIIKGISTLERVYALSATPYRSDGLDVYIEGYCGPVLINRDAVWGIRNNYLASPHFIVKKIRSWAREHKKDKLINYKNAVLNNVAVKNIMEADIRKNMEQNRCVLVIVDAVEHGRELSKNLGVPLATGEDKESEDHIEDFIKGKIKTLIGVDLKIGEGVDTKPVEVLFMLNFAASKGFVTQTVGRALRRTDTKDKCFIVDYMIEDNAMLSRHSQLRMDLYRELGPVTIR